MLRNFTVIWSVIVGTCWSLGQEDRKSFWARKTNNSNRERENRREKDGEKPSRPTKIWKGYKTGLVCLSKVKLIKETRSSKTLLQFK